MSDRLDRGIHADALRLRDWTIYPKLNRFEGPDGVVQVEPRLMEVLMCLVARQGEVLSRGEILDKVWSDVVVGEEALTRAISELRRILGDDTQQPIYIETIRKGGYRLLPAVEVVPRPEAEPAELDVTGEAPAPRRVGHRSLLWPVVAIAVAAALWIGTRRDDSMPPPTGGVGPLQTIPLTSYPGRETLPSLSPDGSMVAFGWNGPNEDNMDIYVKQIGEESPLRLTDDPGWDTYPVWAPGGQSLTYIHADQSGQAVWEVPLLGGAPREILKARHAIMGFTWVDDKTLIYADAEVPDGSARIFRRDMATGEDERLFETHDDGSDYVPLLGPDGATLAFLRSEQDGRTNIYLLNLAENTPRRLTHGLENIEGLSWDRAGESLVFSTRMSGNYTLWRAAVADGSVSWIPVHGEWMFYPSVARDADRMVYQHRWFEKNVWRITVENEPALGLTTEPIITSTRWDCEAYYAPDGNHLAFTSARSGNLEIWACQADGARPVQLTQFAGPSVGSPSWSPEGSRIALAASPDGFSNLYIAEYADRSLRRVTHGRHHDLTPSWSTDGKWLYCGSNRGGSWQVWKVPADGDTTVAPVQMTVEGGIRARASIDGRHLYFARKNDSGLWRLPLAAGRPDGPAEQILTDLPHRGDWDNWDYWSGGLVLLDYDDEGPFLVRHEFATGETTKVSHVPNVASPSVTISPDGRHLLYARIENSVIDLMLVEGFR